jgi:hypothetical protein
MHALEAPDQSPTFQQRQEYFGQLIAGMEAQFTGEQPAIEPVLEPVVAHYTQPRHALNRPVPAVTHATPWVRRPAAVQPAPYPQATGRAPVVIPGPDGVIMPPKPRPLTRAEKTEPNAPVPTWKYINRRPDDQRDRDGVPLERLQFTASTPIEDTTLTRLWENGGIEQKPALPMRIVKSPGQKPVVSAPAVEIGVLTTGNHIIRSHRAEKQPSRTGRFLRRALGSLMLTAAVTAPVVAFYQPGSVH